MHSTSSPPIPPPLYHALLLIPTHPSTSPPPFPPPNIPTLPSTSTPSHPPIPPAVNKVITHPLLPLLS
ncbi:hypothetical protein Pmani_015909 [Petrolisthes manimaculis]|uniref:Uncharacterized protein n=1 Tax=Petrolisthes manimaculis TaxID=1843537 RepID=A0AAE1PR24_9EUCA|nr:hypothetical protein Pmani_015909 [Petrolisthes manimaculis]